MIGVVQRLERDAAALVGLRELLRQPAGDGVEVGLGRLDRDAGFRRPTTWKMYAPRARGGTLTSDRIAQMLRLPQDLEVLRHDADHRKSVPSKRISRPTTPGSALKRVRQNASLITTALARVASSSAENVRPAIGVTPRTSKIPDVTHWRATVSALPSAPAITMPPTLGVKPAMFSNVRLRAFQSSRLSGEA